MTASASPDLSAVFGGPDRALGIDIGGSGIKSALVDTATGALLTRRERVDTPQPATPAAVTEIVGQMVADLAWTGPIGATLPSVVSHGVARSAANVDRSWIGTDADALFTKATAASVTVLNDADAAGLAEVRFGAARGVPGVVMVLTFGTGIGSALFIDGTLVPNTELGHVELDGHDAEQKAAASAKENDGLSFTDWATRVQRYLTHIERLFTPDLFVVGGGVSKASAKWVPLLELRTPIKVAELLNNAGIVGAAMAAIERGAAPGSSSADALAALDTRGSLQ